MKMTSSGDDQKSLVSSAWTALIGGWLLCSVFAALACTIWYGRSIMVQYWQASQVGPFEQACLAELSRAPQLAAGLQALCRHFEIATSTCLGLTAWAIFFLGLIALLCALHARFGWRVLKHMRTRDLRDKTPDSMGQPADGAPEPPP